MPEARRGLATLSDDTMHMPQQSTQALASARSQSAGSRCRLAPGWSDALVTIAWLLMLVTATNARADEAQTAPIEQLLEQLDADRFRTRQAAAAELAEAGTNMLKPMALHSFAASPESAWRIRAVIEQIGTQGDEDTFYKATGILRLLYPVDDAATAERAELLRQKWQEARKQKAIEQLESLGAKITDPLRGNPALANQRQRFILNGGAEVFINGRVQTPVKSSRSKKKRSRMVPARDRLTTEQIVGEIDQILTADLETNRERILGEPQEEKDPAVAAGLLSANKIRVVRAGANVNAYRFGVSVVLSDQFLGSAEDLALLRQIPNVTEISWKSRKLDNKRLAAVASVRTISRVSFEACEFSDRPLPKSTWPRFATHAVFKDQQLDANVLRPLEEAPVTSIQLANCQVAPDTHAALAKFESLNEIVLEEFQLDKQWFDTFARVPTLRRINLSLCKFATEDYQAFRRLRPDVRADFTPSAFLGIRSTDQLNINVRRAEAVARMRAQARANAANGKDDANAQPVPLPELNVKRAQAAEGCRISEVVSGSGAEAGGMKAGDVVLNIDDHAISSFEDIRLVVAQHRAGETLNVKVKRRGELKQLKITLSKFPNEAIR